MFDAFILLHSDAASAGVDISLALLYATEYVCCDADVIATLGFPVAIVPRFKTANPIHASFDAVCTANTVLLLFLPLRKNVASAIPPPAYKKPLFLLWLS